VPADELITRALVRAAPLHGAPGSGAYQDYLLQAGRYLARRLGHEPLRLETILQQLQP